MSLEKGAFGPKTTSPETIDPIATPLTTGEKFFQTIDKTSDQDTINAATKAFTLIENIPKVTAQEIQSFFSDNNRLSNSGVFAQKLGGSQIFSAEITGKQKEAIQANPELVEALAQLAEERRESRAQAQNAEALAVGATAAFTRIERSPKVTAQEIQSFFSDNNRL
ncbi:MAG: hypothetical protein AAFO91_15110, partial [Bacteroidota bacterium]